MNYVNSSVYSLQYHLIFVTKYRRKVLTSQALYEIQAKVSELLAKDSSKLIEFNGEADHIHLLLELSPKVSVSETVGKLKSETSRMCFRSNPTYFNRFYWKSNSLWSKSYCVLSVGGAPLEVLKRYIKNQARPD